MALDKINHVVTLMLENRSFDNIFGKLHPKSDAFDGLSGEESNSDPHGQPVRVSNQAGSAHDVLCVPTPDPGELWSDINEQIFGAEAANAGLFSQPTMGGFVTNYLRQTDQPAASYAGDAVMHYFTPDQVPVMSSLARQFAVCDRWFASAPCQTWPNRFFVHTATAGGYENNRPAVLYQMPTIFEKLHDEVGPASWRIYYHDIAQSMALSNLWTHPRHFSQFSQFLADASTGNLPSYAFIEPRYFPDYELPNDQHPPHNVSLGERLVADVYNALRNGPAWESTLLIVTYDEHGGCYDHVPPPRAVPPGPDVSQPFNFDRYGVRVPTIIVSPYVKPGTVLRPPGDVPFDHTSIAATLRKRFRLARPLSRRDEVAPNIGAALALDHPDNPGPQRVTPVQIESTRALAEDARPKQVNDLQRSLLALSRTLPESADDVQSPVAVNARRRSIGETTAAMAQVTAGEAAPEVKRRVNRFLAAGETGMPSGQTDGVSKRRPDEDVGRQAVPVPAGGTRFSPTLPSRRGRKRAFVVGNAAYVHVTPLQNTVADATTLRENLTAMGFDVHGGINCGLAEMKEWFDAFAKEIKTGDTVVFHYSGHGIQINGQNYLVPVDMSLAVLQQLDEAMRLQALVDRILSAHAGRCVIFIDACRDNPFSTGDTATVSGARRIAALPQLMGGALASRGLAPLEVAADAQAFIAFAAEPGKFAYEGGGPHGRFTGAVIRHMDTQGLSLDGLMQRVGAEVKTATDGKQRPWNQSNLTEDFFFRPASWAPVWSLATLGALAGIPTSWFVFDHVNGKFSYSRVGGIFFALVVGYAVWRWGRRSLMDSAVATLVSALFFAAGTWVMKEIGVFTEPRSAFGYPFWQNTKFLRDLLATQIAGPLFIFGAFIAGSLTTPALRRWRVYGFAAVAGALVTIIVAAIAGIQYKLNPQPAVTTSDYVLDVVGAMLWQGILGAALGYGLSDYVQPPKDWREPKSNKDLPV